MSERDFKGVWIPKEIWLNEDLTLLEKCIFVEIDSLDNENHCIAGNKYFAEFCDCSESKITKAIKKLVDLGMIEILEFDGRHRKIRVVKSTMQNSKKSEAEQYKVRTNNIINNTTNNINNNLSKDKLFNANFGKKLPVKETLYTKCEKEIFKFSKDETVKNTLMAYLDVWITLRDKHPSYEGWKRILNKLKTQFIEEDWIDIIKNSIKKRYATFCQPTTYENKPTKKFDEHINRDGRYDSVSHERTGGKVF